MLNLESVGAVRERERERERELQFKNEKNNNYIRDG